jgi:N6-L-threonylcarbamoyladenine synthase
MRILGIETSCDETSAAVVEETGDASRPWAIRSNVIASQGPIHREWGGVVPELASRQHIRDICGVGARARPPPPAGGRSTTRRRAGAISVRSP